MKLLFFVAFVAAIFAQNLAWGRAKPQCDQSDQCGPNETYNPCGSACAPRCFDRMSDKRMCPAVCVPMCMCAEGTIRNSAGRCVKYADCS